MRYRLDVVAPSVPEVVQYAGGWLVDRVMAGWDVTVLISGDDDLRPLEILGVEIADLEAALEMWAERPHPQTVAVAADLFGSDARVREGVLNALDQGMTEVTLWGEQLARRTRRTVGSVAASTQRRGAGVQGPGAGGRRRSPTRWPSIGAETFRCGVMACPSVAADLVPAS